MPTDPSKDPTKDPTASGSSTKQSEDVGAQRTSDVEESPPTSMLTVKHLHHKKSIRKLKGKKSIHPKVAGRGQGHGHGHTDASEDDHHDDVGLPLGGLPKKEHDPDSISLYSVAGSDLQIISSTQAHFESLLDSENDRLHPDENDIRNRNTWSVESFEATPDRIFQGKFLDALRPFYRIMIILGRHPFQVFWRQDDGLDCSPFYQVIWTSPRAIWCILISGFNFLLCLWVWIACALFFTDLNVVHWSDHNKNYWRYVRSHELILLKRNITTFIIFQMCIFHLFIVHFLVFYKKRFTCQYATFWLESVELLRLHCVTGIRMFFWWKIGFFIFFTVVEITLFNAGYLQLLQGTGATIGLLLLRIFDQEMVMRNEKAFTGIRIFGMVVFIYVFMLAKCSAIQFAVRCRLINNLVEVWNRRFHVCLHGTKEEQEGMIRSTRAYLFKDHCVWVNILEGANREIFLQIESFFLMVCVSFVVELHHMVRAVTGNEFDLNRKLDFFAAFVFLVIDLYYFYNAGIEAGLLIDTVTQAYDIVREKGVLSKKVNQEVTFMMSLQLSLMGSTDELGMGLIGWDFVYFSKTFMLVALGFSISFFVMLWQYQQPLDQYIGNDRYCDRVDVKTFLNNVLSPRLAFPTIPTHRSGCIGDGDYKSYL